jgi:hypothetical protein
MGSGPNDLTDPRTFFRFIIDRLNLARIPRNVQAGYIMASMNLIDNEWCRNNIDFTTTNESATEAIFYTNFCQQFIDGENGNVRTSQDINTLMNLKYEQQTTMDYPTWVRSYASTQSLAELGLQTRTKS